MNSPGNGPSEALESVVARYGRMVKSVGFRHGLSEADVDEVMQEVRIRLWRSKKTSGKIRGAPTSYVYRTAHSAALDLLRRRRARRDSPMEGGQNGLELSDPHPRPDEHAERAEQREQLSQAVENLSDTRRPVVRMYLAGYSRQEIAEFFEWSEAKTRNLLYRGLDDLRAALSRRGSRAEVAE